MKKILLLLLFTCSIFSCVVVEEADQIEEPQDPIIGVWKFYKQVEYGIEVEQNPCRYEDTLIYDADGTSTLEYFSVSEEGDCKSLLIGTNTWSSTDGVYTEKIFFKTEYSDPGEETSVLEHKFEDDLFYDYRFDELHNADKTFLVIWKRVLE